MQPPTQPPSLFWALLEPLVPRVLIILFVNVGVIMPGSGRKVFSEPPGLLPLLPGASDTGVPAQGVAPFLDAE